MRFAALAALALLLSGCPEKCIDDAPCTCLNGASGQTRCDVSGVAAACRCLDTDGGAGGGTGGSTGGGGGGATGGGGGSTGGGGGTLPSVSLQTFCTDYPQEACHQSIACGRYSDAGFDVCVTRTFASMGDLCRRSDAGYLTFDGVQAARCLSVLSGQPPTCISNFEPCGNALYGPGLGSMQTGVFSRPPNGCGTATCGAGTTCDLRCSGPQCLPPRQRGESCDDTSTGLLQPCASDSVCGSTDGGAFTCLAIPARGEDCSTLTCATDDYCSYATNPPRCAAILQRDQPCSPGERCFDGVCRGADGRCGALAAGARCLAGGDCGNFDAPFICIGLQRSADGGTLDAGICSPKPLLGQPCSRQWAGYDPCRRNDGEACLDGVCAPLTQLSLPLGAECPTRPYGYVAVPYFGFNSCVRGTVCRASTTASPPQTGRCQTPLQRGEPCRDDLACAPGLSCFSEEDGGRGCAPLLALGETCIPGRCVSDLSCEPQPDGGRECQPLYALDAGCGGYQSCVPQAQCVGGICIPLGALGTVCQYGFECASGDCEQGLCVGQCLH